MSLGVTGSLVQILSARQMGRPNDRPSHDANGIAELAARHIFLSTYVTGAPGQPCGPLTRSIQFEWNIKEVGPTKMLTKFRRGAVVMALMMTALSGCATISPSPITTNHVDTISASRTCDAVGKALTVSFNAKEGFRLGHVDHGAFVQQLTESRTLLGAVVAEPGTDIAKDLSDLVSFVESSVPAADGAPFDTTSTEYSDLVGTLGGACTAAGSDVIIEAAYGG